jgi:Importin beta binding domain
VNVDYLRNMDEPESPSKGAGSNRLKAYKYKGLDVSELRRQREEEGIQLRKQKKEQLVTLTEYFTIM